MLVCKYANVQTCRNASMKLYARMQLNASIKTCKYIACKNASMHVFKYASKYKCNCMQAFKYVCYFFMLLLASMQLHASMHSRMQNDKQ